MKNTLDNIAFTNSFVDIGDEFYSRISPTPFTKESQLIHFNPQAASLLDLDPCVTDNKEFTEIFSGQKLHKASIPIAMLYSGHQFGHYVEQLGDGRAIMIGEVTNQQKQPWEIQLKGSGITPYSRQGDGRAVLRSSIREYLCSEAMHGLGIPTTRALCLIGNDDEVYREKIETAAIVTRLAPSHIRFGSFEIFYYRSQLENIKKLADYVIGKFYSEFLEADNPYLELLKEVIDRTAKLIAQWQSVGFAHGVMNSDNMSILGLTIDYGPFGFLDNYNPKFICNHSDYEGRYAFENQPQIGLFNLSCLAQALLPLIDVDPAKNALATYQDSYTRYYNNLMAGKLGFNTSNPAIESLVHTLLEQLQQSNTDYTIFFRRLSTENLLTDNTLRDMFVDRTAFNHWLTQYMKLHNELGTQFDALQVKMQAMNPKYILRNYIAQTIIQKAEQDNDFSEIDTLINILHNPFSEHPGYEKYAQHPPEWADSISVSCSS